MNWISAAMGLLITATVSLAQSAPSSPAQSLNLPRIEGTAPRNIIYILADDHRYDTMSFMGHPFVQTPNLDRLAHEGAHLKNAFVTTSLCSPSRASILTGQYAHHHRVVDNYNPIPDGTVYFPQYLQAAGYQTAFIGKWHMGHESDDPQPGFNHWISFRGQGTYRPSPDGLNIDGKHVPQKGYITDELTNYALDWLEKGRDAGKPFFLYLSHKGVHSNFVPAPRYRDRYKDAPWTPPFTEDPSHVSGAPKWVLDQRNSFHGVDFPYHGTLDIADYHRKYCETLLAVDDSVGSILKYLEKNNLADSTLVVYMGDNGFAFGEHGLIDKRTAYEESMRVPLLMRCPDLIKPGTVIDEVVANIDLAPTFLTLAGLQPPRNMDGQSYAPILAGQKLPWRDALLYEYYWERNFPQTPTLFALRTAQYKYIRPQGIWDTEEIYDIQKDPLESKNLIADPGMKAVARQMNHQLFDILEKTGGMHMTLNRDVGESNNLRPPFGAKPADFPENLWANPSSSAQPK